jgi:hypothetical protein
MLRVRITTVATEQQRCLPFAYLLPYVCVTVKRIKPLRVAVETQEWVPFALLSSYEVFHTAVNHTRVLRSSSTVPDIFVRF